MAEKLDPKEIVSLEDLLLSNTIEQEALINLLDKKGLISKQELLDEIAKLQKLPGHEIIDGRAADRERELMEELEKDDDDF